MSANVTYNPDDYSPDDTLQGPFASQEYLDLYWKPFFIGWMFCILFYGFACCMTWNYITSASFKADKLRVRLLVAATFLTTTFAAISSSKKIVRWVYVAVVGGGITLSLAGTIMYTKGIISREGSAIEIQIDQTGGLTYVTSGVLDFVLSMTLAFLFLRDRKSFSEQTDSMLKTLAMVAVQSAFFTTAFGLGAGLSLILLPLAPFYLMALINSLNGRQKARDILTAKATQFSLKTWNDPSGPGAKSSAPGGVFSIGYDREKALEEV
ncbi:hypothetical protein MNV49_006381 [Pseudohyphozyma bogoriensis]|nr:hypothetical protein MNV49_006381 [Pseudohyphozyma bogoriensis]